MVEFLDSQDKQDRRGFTLIELLVVISIIAMLLAILMPALGMVKEKSRAVLCKSNIKQWGLIHTLYAQDNEGSLTQSVAGSGVNARMAYWPGATMPYYDEAKIRFCPMTKSDQIGNPNDYTGQDYGNTKENWGPLGPSTANTWWDEYPEGSYGINEWCANPPGDTYWGLSSSNAWKNMNVKRANNVPLFMDCAFVDGAPTDNNLPPMQPDNATGWVSMDVFCMDRHNGGIQVVFLDASVRSVTIRELWTLKWNRNFDINNRVSREDFDWTQYSWIKK